MRFLENAENWINANRQSPARNTGPSHTLESSACVDIWWNVWDDLISLSDIVPLSEYIDLVRGFSDSEETCFLNGSDSCVADSNLWHL